MANLGIDWNIDDVVYGNLKRIITKITMTGEASLTIDNFDDVKITKINNLQTRGDIFDNEAEVLLLEEIDYDGKKVHKFTGEHYELLYATFHYEQNFEYAERMHKIVVGKFLTEEFAHIIGNANKL